MCCRQPPAADAEAVRQADRLRHDLAEAVADQAGIGGGVDVGGDDDAVPADGLGRLGHEPIPLGHDQVVDPLNRVG